jgi:5-methylcytosine-specific restriction endonuclease McrA
MKTCYSCKETKSLDDFHRNKTRSDGRTSRCKVCQKRLSKEYREKNSDKISETNKSYRENNSDRLREYQREWVKENRDRVNENNKRYRQTEKGKELAYRKNMKRRSHKHRVYFRPHHRKVILDRDSWKCRCCGVDVHDRRDNTPDKAHIDHIVPISKGGNSEPDNLQVLCRTCNLSKADKIAQ